MTPMEALLYIFNAAGMANLNRDTHGQIVKAFDIVVRSLEKIQKKEKKAEKAE